MVGFVFGRLQASVADERAIFVSDPAEFYDFQARVFSGIAYLAILPGRRLCRRKIE
jgi:hypothetical protein